ncbi:MAG: VWA domain-containing protein [Planctomycetales bacterium]|nr:VWA domain-containing protein [Planctomycetales bacterium]
MDKISLTFEYPWLLALLVLLPILWVGSFRALAGLGPGRRLAALIFRSVLISLLVLAIAGVQWVWTSDKLTVIYLLDQSDSIPRAKRDIMLRYAIQSVRAHRDREREDRSGLIVFGQDAAIEFPPYDDDLPDVDGLESYLGRTDATNLESALKLAQASFPEDAAKRVVIITDGNETTGTASTVAQAMSQSGIGIDVVPIRMETTSEILVEKIDLPNNIRQGQPFETRIVVNRYQEAETEHSVPGKLSLFRTAGSQTDKLLETEVILEDDVNVFPIRDTIDLPAGYTYRAEFVPDNKNDDTLVQNNRADSFTFVRGKGRVLLIEDWRSPGEYSQLINSLGRSEIEVDVRPSDQLFTSLAELQVYDCVVLAGVPRSSGEDASQIASFSDEQISMLVRNTEQFGCGLLMLGGPNAFGAGGWANTELEKAMPVDFQIKNKKMEAVGALAMVMHASEIAQGNYWQKRIGQTALEVLGPMDYCGVLQYGSLGDSWLWGGQQGMLRVGENRNAMIRRMRAMVPGDMPDFEPSMRLALNSLISTPASIKHMIIISDGDPTAPSNAILSGFSQAQIKISTVAVGAHGPAGHQILQKIATTTGGNYYVATNPQVLPKIFQREAMRVSRALVNEPEGGTKPVITYSHEIIQGLPRDLPVVKGFVLTTVKESQLVEVPIRFDKPSDVENQTALATWTYGAGRTAVFTSDVGKRWLGSWNDWSGYDQFFSQLVRWTMRPVKSDAKFTISTGVASTGQVEVVVNALNQDDEFLNFLDMQAVAVGPDLKPLPIIMHQSAPGRYVGTFETGGAGSYLVNVMPAPGMAPLTTGASVPFSSEYRIRQTNFNMLEKISRQTPEGGNVGNLSEPLDEASFEALLKNDTYRGGLPRAMSLQDVWPWCVLIGAFCLFGDIFVRRVALDYAYPVKWLVQRIRGTTSKADTDRQASLQRLRSRKTEVSQAIQQNVAASRFEVDDQTVQAVNLDAVVPIDTHKHPRATTPNTPSMQQTDDKGDDYTARLLAAKRAAKRRNEGS